MTLLSKPGEVDWALAAALSKVSIWATTVLTILLAVACIAIFSSTPSGPAAAAAAHRKPALSAKRRYELAKRTSAHLVKDIQLCKKSAGAVKALLRDKDDLRSAPPARVSNPHPHVHASAIPSKSTCLAKASFPSSSWFE